MSYKLSLEMELPDIETAIRSCHDLMKAVCNNDDHAWKTSTPIVFIIKDENGLEVPMGRNPVPKDDVS